MSTPVDINMRVDQFVRMRDLIKKKDEDHKKAMAPYREALDQLNSVLLSHLNTIGGESVKTESGTVYKTERKSAPIADRTAFWAYVVTTGNWDLLDYKANVTAVADHIDSQGNPPPGVNFSTAHVVGVRRA